MTELPPVIRDCSESCSLPCWGSGYLVAAGVLAALLALACAWLLRTQEAMVLSALSLVAVLSICGAMHGACEECRAACAEYNDAIRKGWPNPGRTDGADVHKHLR